MSTNPSSCGFECAVPPDPELLTQGWVRRSLVSIDKAAEMHRQYTEIGFEVLERSLTPADFDSKCAPCAEGSAHAMVVLYTRKK